jgi:hypothetical protein
MNFASRGTGGGQHPINLILTGGHAALHIGEHDIGDGGVERLHQRGDDRTRGDVVAAERIFTSEMLDVGTNRVPR